MNIELAIAELEELASDFGTDMELPFSLTPTDLVRLGCAYNGFENEVDAVCLSEGIYLDDRFYPVDFIEQLWNV